MKTIDNFLQEVANDTKVVCKALVFRGDEILLLRRRIDPPKIGKGKWDLPGGHIKKNEKPINGLKREIFEETGSSVSNVVYIKTLQMTNNVTGQVEPIRLYKCKIDVPTNVKINAQGPKEHSQYKWVKYHHELSSMGMRKPVRNFVKKYLKKYPEQIWN